MRGSIGCTPTRVLALRRARSTETATSSVRPRWLPRSCSRSRSGRRLATASLASLQLGDRIPDVRLRRFDDEGALVEVSTARLFAGRRAALFSFPGAFLPTCTTHLEQCVSRQDDMHERGVDVVVCVCVNDPHVTRAWERSIPRGVGRVLVLADGAGDFASAVGATLDLSHRGLGVRAKRYAALVDDGVVVASFVEDGGELNVSAVHHVLGAL